MTGMKGLLTSDFLWFKSQRKLLLILVALGALYMIGDMIDFMCSFIPLFLCVLGAKSIVINLESNQSRFLFTLPFTRRTYVNEKYLLSLTLAIIPTVLIIVFTVLFGKLTWGVGAMFAAIAIAACTLSISVLIPFFIHFGNNATMALMLLTGGMAIALVFLSDIASEHAPAILSALQSHIALISICAVVILAAILIGSWLLSIKLMAKKEF